MTIAGRTLAALLAVLGRPSWWMLGLAGFLVRGGIVVFLVAIITLPSPLALANMFGPIVTPLYLGRVEPSTVALIVSAATLAAAWIVGGSWVAAATEVVLIADARRAAIEEGLPTGAEPPRSRMLISRAAVAHLLALAPLALVLAIASVQITTVTYRELVNPSDTGSIVLRVMARAVGQVAAVAVAWIAGELVGGRAVRRIVLGGESVVGALTRATWDLVRQPLAMVIAPLVTLVLLAVELAAVLTVVVIVWTEVRTALNGPLDAPLATGLTIATLGAAWALALVVTGLIAAWRSVAMTFEAERVASLAGRVRSRDEREATGAEGGSGPEGGTFGAPTGRRPGDWSADDRGGSL